MSTPIRRTDQRAEFATAQTNKGMQEAMSQYQSWAKQNPSQAGPTAGQTYDMSSYAPPAPKTPHNFFSTNAYTASGGQRVTQGERPALAPNDQLMISENQRSATALANSRRQAAEAQMAAARRAASQAGTQPPDTFRAYPQASVAGAAQPVQPAMSQYQSWAKQNPESATPQPSNMSAYTPKVSDMKPAAMGGVNTAYTQAWNAYAPPVNTTRQIASADPLRGIPRRTQQTYRTTEAKSYGGEGQGNLAYMPNDKRPAAFQAAYNDFDGSLRDAPVTNQRDALIERINATAQPYYANSGVGTKDMGRQQFDMPRLMRESKDMAANGYSNPLLQGLFAR